jgi:hypothetical protein
MCAHDGTAEEQKQSLLLFVLLSLVRKEEVFSQLTMACCSSTAIYFNSFPSNRFDFKHE